MCSRVWDVSSDNEARPPGLRVRPVSVQWDTIGAMTNDVRDYWDAQAATFDEEADHGLLDPKVREAWLSLLRPCLPAPPASVVDLGCGTGTLSVLLAEQGYDVRGVDISAPMVEAARAKAATAGLDVTFTQGDAARPPYSPGSCDVVLSRHVLWAVPDPSAALDRWMDLLRPDGRLVLVEGHWFTGGGLAAAACEALVREHREEATVQLLTDPTLWGGPIDDERYLLVSLG